MKIFFAIETLSYTSVEEGVSFFKKTMNENFIPYVNRQKMKRAKQLFAEGKMVYQVSDILGYENSTYFSKVFKKVEGITPEQYRKNLQS